MEIRSEQNQECLENDFDIVAIIRTIWNGRRSISILTVLSTICAITISLYLPNIYTSQVLLAPVAQPNNQSISGLAGKLGGFAGLAGIDLGGAGVDKSTLGIETLKSRAFLIQFIKRYDLAVPLIAAKSWDFKNNKWVVDSSIFNENEQQWVKGGYSGKNEQPSDLDIYEVFSKAVNISQDKRSKMITLTVESISPLYAKEWAQKLVVDLNVYMRKSDMEESQRSIEFLEKQLERTSVAEMQSVLYQLIEQQTKTMMLAEVRDEYVFRIVDPSVVPEKKTGPKRALIVMSAFILAIVLGSIMVILFSAYKNAKIND